MLLTFACATLADAQVETPTWHLEEISRVGAVDGPLALTEVGSATTTLDGRTLYIAQPQQNTIWIVDVDGGGLTGKIGRSGEGPGEFRRLDHLGWRGDTLYATDGLLGRVSLFGGDGEFLRDVRMTPTSLPGTTHIAYPVAYADSGRIVARSRLNTMAVADGATTQDPVALLEPDGTVIRLLASIDVRDTHTTVPLGRAVTWQYQPYSVRNLVGVDRREGSIAIVTQPVGEDPTGSFHVRLVRPDGRVVFERSYRYTPQRIPPAYADSVYEAEAQVYAGTGFVSLGSARRIVREHQRIPAYFPPVADVVLSDEGDVWLRAHSAAGAVVRWTALDAVGSIRATVLAPAEVRLMTIGHSYAWGRVYDDFELPRLVRYRIRR